MTLLDYVYGHGWWQVTYMRILACLPTYQHLCQLLKNHVLLHCPLQLSEAATAVAKAFEKQDGSGSACSGSSSSPSVGVSPGKAVDLRMKNYQQLRYIQQLYDDGILTELEYTEQKREILASLKRL